MKRQQEQAEHVERSDPGRQHAQPIEKGIGVGAVVRGQQDGVLAEKAVKAGRSRDRQGRGEHGAVGPGNALAKAAHAPHVLLAAHRVHHAAGAQKEQSLEKGMRHQVEDSGAERAHTASQKHVAQLADGRVGEHLLDVGLDQGDGGRKESR